MAETQAMVLQAPAVISTEKGFTISSTGSPVSYRELATQTGMDPKSLKMQLETYGAEFNADMQFFFELEFSAELAMVIFANSKAAPEKTEPSHSDLSESPANDEPEAVAPAEIAETTADATEKKTDAKAVTAVVKPIIALDFMSYTLTTSEVPETCTELKETLGCTQATILAEVYANHGSLTTDDYASFGNIGDAEKAADAITKRVMSVAAEESTEAEETDEPEPKKEPEPEIIPDFTDYHEKLQYELNKIKKQFCEDPENPAPHERNFLATFMFYIACIDQRVAADSSFAEKVLDKRLNLDLLNKFLMSRAMDLLAPTGDGNVALKEDVEEDKAKKKGGKPSNTRDYTRFTTNLGDVSTKYGSAKGFGLHISDSDMVGWVADFYDHEGEVLYENIKKELEEKARKKAEAAAKAKAKKTAKGKAKKTNSTSAKAPAKKASEQATVEVAAPAETVPAPAEKKTEEKPLTASEIYGMDKPYELNGNGFAQMNFMSMLQ